MNPYLWGPALWQALFACAWVAKPTAGKTLRRLILELLPLLLPCDKCVAHFLKKHARVTSKVKGEPDTPERAFRWLWNLKNEVNVAAHVRSIGMDDLAQRYLFHGPIVDDVLLGDSLVFVAMGAHESGRDDFFVEFCGILGSLLPLPEDSELLMALRTMKRPVVAGAVRAAKAARIERGLPEFNHSHYKCMSEE